MNVEVNHPNLSVNFKTERVYPELEDLEVTPTMEEQNFKSSKYGFDNVTVKRIEGKTLEITPTIEAQKHTGLYEEINVKGIETEELTVTPTEEEQTFTGLYNNVKVNGDSNLLPENIKEGITIFGITGTLTAEDLQATPEIYNVNCIGGGNATSLSNSVTCEVGSMVYAFVLTGLIDVSSVSDGWTLLYSGSSTTTIGHHRYLKIYYKIAESQTENFNVTLASSRLVFNYMLSTKNNYTPLNVIASVEDNSNVSSLTLNSKIEENDIIVASTTMNNSSSKTDSIVPSITTYEKYATSTHEQSLTIFQSKQSASNCKFTYDTSGQGHMIVQLRF